jgi:hypothetical protein
MEAYRDIIWLHILMKLIKEMGLDFMQNGGVATSVDYRMSKQIPVFPTVEL